MDSGKITVLVVDDFVSLHGTLRAMLANIGITSMDEVYDGATAMLFIDQRKYSLIFADVNMPLLNGLEFIKTIRQNEGKNIRTPVIAMTSLLSLELTDRLAAIGASDILLKPFTLAELREKVTTHLRLDT